MQWKEQEQEQKEHSHQMRRRAGGRDGGEAAEEHLHQKCQRFRRWHRKRRQ